ncbi:hypothetical protein RZO50_10065 [Microbacterium sp. SSW1-59]|uniref:hypothetical protein n=1 Tax=Microbacterium xanthum TaxID=3079794 RepID=UPI002AD212E9|nr:hypothetical protein [Microbacterium sp. SSW1-59]MDZ8201866.1 hypothetical protein [Microbacterium sp. SSW1-59]
MLHVVGSASDSEGAISATAQIWRQAYLSECPSDLGGMSALADKMFPSLEFHPDAWERVGSLVGPAEENVPLLVHHLGVLNDHASRIWADFSVREDRQSAMGALGVTCSPDSPQTHKYKAAMRERDFTFGSSVVRCEWHTKLRPTKNRIHFNADGGTVRIGTIVDHLTI